ncbi:MAG: TlpA family protein disulfide reductase [Flavobacterium sp.]|nr:TlpA family protein disulfide reductase [Flavobacterium sp.]
MRNKHIFKWVFSLTLTLINFLIITTPKCQNSNSICHNFQINQINGETYTFPLCLKNENVNIDSLTGFGIYQVYEKGEIKAFDVELNYQSNKMNYEWRDTAAKALIIVAYNKNSKDIIASHIVRAPFLLNKTNMSGLNTMAAIYAGTFKSITGISANKDLQQLYLDSFYNSLNLENQNFLVHVDYYIYKKDTINLSNLIHKSISKDILNDYDLKYASIYAKRFLKNVELGYQLDSIRTRKISNNKFLWENKLNDAKTSGKSEDYIKALQILQLDKHKNEKDIPEEVTIKINISKSLANEKNKLSDILNWSPKSLSEYQFWNNYIPIITTAAKKAAKNNTEINDWLKEQEKIILSEKINLKFKPPYLLNHQYLHNLELLLEEITVAKAILNGKTPFEKADINYQRILLEKYPKNETIQLSYFNTSNNILGEKIAFKNLRSIVPITHISKIITDSLKNTELNAKTGINNESDSFRFLLGKNLSSFVFEDAYGREVRINDFKDSLIILDLWATWCIPCIQALPSIIKLKNEFKNESVKFLMLNIFEEKRKTDVINFITQRDFTKESLIFIGKNNSFEKYGINAIPTTIILDNKGIIIDIIQGFEINESNSFEIKLSGIIRKNIKN